MTKDDIKTFLMIITTLIVPILSLGIISPLNKIFFVLIYIFICFLLFTKLFADNGKQKKAIILIASAIEVLLIVSSALDAGSVGRYWERIRNFFVVSQETAGSHAVSSDIDVEPYFNELAEQIAEVDKKIDDNNSSIQRLDGNINIITNGLEDMKFNENISDSEISSIVKKMEDTCEEYTDYFSNVKTNLYSIELIYKLFISKEPYYYCNILKAFESFGINIDKLNITENSLFVWDIEMLYCHYNMKQENLNSLCLDENTIVGKYEYNDYKVTMQNYSDAFDYDGWGWGSEETTAKQMDTILNNRIKEYYKKFILNLSEEF